MPLVFLRNLTIYDVYDPRLEQAVIRFVLVLFFNVENILYYITLSHDMLIRFLKSCVLAILFRRLIFSRITFSS